MVSKSKTLLKGTALYFLIGLTMFSSCVKKYDKVHMYEYFNGKKVIRRETVYNKERLKVWEINYAYNGWQVYDSAYYKYDKDSVCRQMYQPEYKVDERRILKYTFLNKKCSVLKLKFPQKLPDKYSLSQDYFDDLHYLLFEVDSLFNHGDTLKFRYSIIPSMLIEFGIPNNEPLNGFSYKVDEKKFLIRDDYYFENFTVSRVYKYNNDMLQRVSITVTNVETKQVQTYFQEFEIVQ